MDFEIDTVLRLDNKNWVVCTDQGNLKHDYDIYHQIIKLHNEKMQEIRLEFAVMFITNCKDEYPNVAIHQVIFNLDWSISHKQIICRIVDMFSMVNINDDYIILVSPTPESDEINSSYTIRLNAEYLYMAYLLSLHIRENKIVVYYNTYIFC